MHRIIFTGSSDLVSRILFFLMFPAPYSVWSAVCFILCIFISCLIHAFFCGTESPAFLSAGGSVSSSEFQLLFPVHSFLILFLNPRYRFCIFLHALYRKSFDPSDHFSIRILQLRGNPFCFRELSLAVWTVIQRLMLIYLSVSKIFQELLSILTSFLTSLYRSFCSW